MSPYVTFFATRKTQALNNPFKLLRQRSISHDYSLIFGGSPFLPNGWDLSASKSLIHGEVGRGNRPWNPKMLQRSHHKASPTRRWVINCRSALFGPGAQCLGLQRNAVICNNMLGVFRSVLCEENKNVTVVRLAKFHAVLLKHYHKRH